MFSGESEATGMVTPKTEPKQDNRGSERPANAVKPQDYYDRIKDKFARRARPAPEIPPRRHRPVHVGPDGDLAKYEIDPYADESAPRAPINDTVECLFIGGGFSALLTAARLRERGVESIRIVERGADVGGTWYWNRYPGAACDVPSYDYLPLLDEMKYMPVASLRQRARRFSPTARRSRGATISMTWPFSAPPLPPPCGTKMKNSGASAPIAATQ